MYPPLIVDRKDPKRLLLKQVPIITISRRTKQELAKPVTMAGIAIRTILISMFFSVDYAYVIGELQKRRSLRKFARITDVPSVDDVHRFLSRFDKEQFVSFVSGVLNSLCTTIKCRRARTILLDSSAPNGGFGGRPH